MTATATDAGGAALRGMALMLLATVSFSVMHAMIRHVSAEVHPFEIAFFRNLFGLAIVIPWFLRDGWGPLRTNRFGLHLVRGGFNAVAMLTFFQALALTPLADVAALGFTVPIFATVLAILVIGERVGLRRWGAILVGFLGTLIVLRPGVEAVNLGGALVLISSFSWACALTVIKSLSRTDSSVTIVTYMLLMMTPLTGVAALFVWQDPTWTHVAWFAAIAALGTAAQLLITQSLRLAATNVVIPVDFMKLIWAALIGYLAFAEVPGWATWTGGAVIFAATVYIAWRERAAGREAVAAPRTAGH